MGAPEQIVVYTDHKNLEYFNSTKLLNRRQARWVEILCKFNFKIICCPGERNGKPDTLSHRVDPELEGEGEKEDLTIRMFKPGQLDLGTSKEILAAHQIMAVKASQIEESKWSKKILEASLWDNRWLGIQNCLKIGKDNAGLGHYSLENDIITYERCLYIPANNSLKFKVTYQCHDAKVAGHFGQDKTLKLIKRDYYWPNMEDWVRNYVRTCNAC